jgi:hypothetical protein
VIVDWREARGPGGKGIEKENGGADGEDIEEEEAQ